MALQKTQIFVPVREIQNGVIVRDDGVLCAVLLVSTLNFSLKSAEEREAILFQFQSLLNSLEVSIQILIQSRRLNIAPYLEFLQNLYEHQENELLKLQTREYVYFVKEFVALNEIMVKQFFIIVPYSPISSISSGGFSLGKQNKDQKQQSFEENVSQLQQRVSFIQNNIRSLGLRVAQLDTEAVTELLYQTFNPGDTQTPPSTVQ